MSSSQSNRNWLAERIAASRSFRICISAVIGLLTAGVVTAELLHQESVAARLELESARSEAQLSLATLAVRLGGMASNLEQADTVTPSAFAEQYQSLSVSSPRTDERAVAFMLPFTSPQEAKRALSTTADEYESSGYPPFEIFPEPSETGVFPVVFAEPATSRAGVFGFNISENEERLNTANEALQSGEVRITKPVALSQDADSRGDSILLMQPVYQAQFGDLDQRRHGVLAASVTPASLFGGNAESSRHGGIELSAMVGDAKVPLVEIGDHDRSILDVSLISELEMAPIEFPGTIIPVRGSAHWHPGMADLALIILAGAFLIAFAMTILNFIAERANVNVRLSSVLEKKEAELAEMYENRSKSQRLESLGMLVGGVAHDFNNRLMVILGNLEILENRTQSKPDAEAVEEAIEASRSAAQLTRQLLSVGRRSYLEPEVLSVPDELEEASKMLRRVLPETVDISIEVDPSAWSIFVDRDGLSNALLNLAINASDAMRGAGNIRISARNHEYSNGFTDAAGDVISKGRFVNIAFTDDGIGMSRSTLARAFEPFYTTKTRDRGTGLGLPSILGFCRQSGGSCLIESELGGGTTVTLVLPASFEGQRNPVNEQEESSAQETAAANILVVEDEPGVRRVLEKQLRLQGHNVTSVDSGDQALKELDAPKRFAVLITDAVMPGKVQGLQLVEKAKLIDPDLRCILISGYADTLNIDPQDHSDDLTVLCKPIRLDELRTALNDI